MSLTLPALTAACSCPFPVLIMTDMNLPSINWPTFHSPDPLSRSFLNFCADESLSQLVECPTRGDNILDLILTDSPESVDNILVSESRIPSDHREVTFEFSIPNTSPIPSAPVRPRYNFRKGNYPEFGNFLQTVDWEWLFVNAGDPTEMLAWILLILEDGISRFVPLSIPKRQSFRLPLFLRKLRARRNLSCKRRAMSPAHRLKFAAIDKKYQAKLKRFFVNRERRLLSQPNGLYRLMKSASSSPPSQPISLSLPDCPAPSETQTAQAFADRFAQNYQTDDGELPEVPRCAFQARLAEVRVDEGLVQAILQKTKPKLSSGDDGIPPLLLKRLASSLAKPLSLLFALIFLLKSPPSQFLPSLVTPVFKRKAPKTNPANYRPVGVTSSFAKVFESLINNQLLAHLESQDLLSPGQYGFRPRRSTTAQMICCLDDWTTALTTGQSISCVYTDFRAAFDSPPFPKLFQKLASVGISGHLLAFLSAYLPYRVARVRVGQSFSSVYPLTSGAVQGSPLSATLFLIYINDLLIGLANTGVTVAAFADDLKFYSADVNAMQIALDFLSAWCVRWQMKLAPEKCCLLHLGSSEPPNLLLSQVPLPVVGSDGVRDLGFQVDPSLSFSHHVAIIARKARSIVNSIFRAITSRDWSQLVQAFSTYCLPVLEYGSPVFAGMSRAHCGQLESVQRYFTQRVFKRCLLARTSYMQRLKFLSLTALESRRDFADLRFLHAVLHRRMICPAIPSLATCHRYPTTRNRPLRREPNATGIRSDFIINRAASMWNQLSTKTILASRNAFISDCKERFLIQD